MSYSLNTGETVAGGIRRIVAEEAESAAGRLRAASDDDRDKAVHEARKSVKKMRAAIRLVERDLGSSASKDNRRLRSSGRLLSDVRDAAAMIEVIDALGEDSPALAAARASFVAKKTEGEDAGALADAAAEIEKV